MCGHAIFRAGAMATLLIATGFLRVPEEIYRHLLHIVHASHFLCRRALKFACAVDIARRRAAESRATLIEIDPNVDQQPELDDLEFKFPSGDDELDRDALEWIEVCDGFDIDNVAFGGFDVDPDPDPDDEIVVCGTC